MNQNTVSLHVDDGIAVIVIDNPPVNTITAAVRSGLDDAAAQIEGRTDVRAVVIRCAGSTFLSGADIGEFDGPPREEEYRRLFHRYEALPVPVVVAMHGTVLGGGLEFALACHYRIAAPGTRLGLPEVTLGIIPGAGGTQRMPRLIGIEKTVELVLGARPIDAGQALDLGVLDRVVEGELEHAAVSFARELVSTGAGPRRTGERSVEPVADGVIARLAEQARKQYPNRQAALTAIDAIAASARLPLDQGLEYENQRVNQVKESIEAKASIHVFFAERESRKVPGLPSGTQPRAVESAGIVGCGTMGAGIAVCFANADIPVTVLEVNQEALDRGLKSIDALYASRVKRGRISEDEKAKRLALIRGTTDYADLGSADVIIEAVLERMDLKKQIFAKLDEVAKPGAVLATNTSTLDIDEIASAVSRPGDVIGMHFFSPANVMPLLEVVRTSQTSADTIATVMALSRPLRKTPVLARVCYGFIGNRMMEGYAREAERMVLEGATPRQVDTVLEQWGMAMGILAVFDMAGIDVGVNVHKSNADRYPPDPTYYQADFALYDAGRLGQKTGKGYYRYEPGDRKRYDDPEAIEILRERARKLGVEQREHSEQEILERCLYPLLNEGIRILEEGIALRASDIDVVWTSGYGFPRYRGGPMFYADTIGLGTLLEGMRKYQSRGLLHFEPAELLVKLASEGKTIAQWEQERKNVH